MEEENIIAEIKKYDKDNYIKLSNSNLTTIINGISISSIDLFSYDLLKTNNGLVKMTYTDMNNPFVIEKDFSNKYKLNINIEYYLKHREECQSIINYIIKHSSEKRFSLLHKGLLNGDTIDKLCANSNIETISIEKYSSNPYVLSVDDYNVFKKHNKKIDTSLVCDELKDVFDDSIVFNSNKTLISSYKYSDLVNNKIFIINKVLNQEELKYIGLINKESKIDLNVDDYDFVFKFINLINSNKGNNSFSVRVNDKEKFNEYVLKNNITGNNIKVDTSPFDDINLNEYINFEKILYKMVEPARNLSNFEKYIYAYNITKRFKDYKENKEDKTQSRNLYSILTNEYMVCVGFSNLLSDLLNKLGVPNMKLSISVDESYDNVRNDVEYVDSRVVTNHAGHARLYVNLVDEKYGLNGFYVSDPTWDNDLEKDFYNHSIMTDKESNMSYRYQWGNNYDIFDIENISDYYSRVKNKFNKETYGSFCVYFKSVIENLCELDKSFYDTINDKYSYIKDKAFRWPNDITELVNDVGVYLLSKVNKIIDGNTLFNCIRNIYTNIYCYDENNVDEILEDVREYNMKRQGKTFPIRKKFNSDGTIDIIMNENNKFDFDFDSENKAL